MDGSISQNTDAKYALNLLGDIPNIHLLATCEKIDSCLGWYVKTEDKIGWHAYDVTSFNDCKLEVTNKKKIEKVDQNCQLKRKELKTVLTSWNSHRRAMFATLADHIVTATKRGEIDGDSLDFNTLFQCCLDNFICY